MVKFSFHFTCMMEKILNCYFTKILNTIKAKLNAEKDHKQNTNFIHPNVKQTSLHLSAIFFEYEHSEQQSQSQVICDIVWRSLKTLQHKFALKMFLSSAASTGA